MRVQTAAKHVVAVAGAGGRGDAAARAAVPKPRPRRAALAAQLHLTKTYDHVNTCKNNLVMNIGYTKCIN